MKLTTQFKSVIVEEEMQEQNILKYWKNKQTNKLCMNYEKMYLLV